MAMNLAAMILEIAAPATRQTPTDLNEIAHAARRRLPGVTPDRLSDALEHLIDQRLLVHCRVTRDEVTRDLYWPTGRTHPTLTPTPNRTQTNMAKESNTARLRRTIDASGPISGPDLSGRAKIAQRDLHALLAGPIRRGEVMVRIGFSKDHGRDIRHYMTPDQARIWDEGEQAYEALKQDADTPVSGAEIQVNEIDPADLMSDLEALAAERDGLLGLIGVNNHADAIDQVDAWRRKIHDQANDIAAAQLVLGQIAERLQVEAHDQIPAAMDDLMRAVIEHGRLALLVIDSADLTEIDPLDTEDITEAIQRAMSAVDRGEAARAVVIRVLGEARRQVQWLEAA